MDTPVVPHEKISRSHRDLDRSPAVVAAGADAPSGLESGVGDVPAEPSLSSESEEAM